MASSEQQPYILINPADLKILITAAQLILDGFEPSSKLKPGTDMLTAKEFMDAAAIKRTYFYKLVSTGKLKSVRKGRRIKVPASELKRYWNDPTFK